MLNALSSQSSVVQKRHLRIQLMTEAVSMYLKPTGKNYIDYIVGILNSLFLEDLFYYVRMSLEPWMFSDVLNMFLAGL